MDYCLWKSENFISLKLNLCILKASNETKNILQWHISNSVYFYSNFTYLLISCMDLKTNSFTSV